MADDPYGLDRFVEAQDAHDTYDTALGELRRGRKTSHWMWFVFPQVGGLGSSAISQRYAVSGLDEARAYLAHPTLGPRLRQCVQALLEGEATSAIDMLGGVDATKLRSSMTLFAAADPDDPAYAAVLERFFDGRPDPATTSRL